MRMDSVTPSTKKSAKERLGLDHNPSPSRTVTQQPTQIFTQVRHFPCYVDYYRFLYVLEDSQDFQRFKRFLGTTCCSYTLYRTHFYFHFHINMTQQVIFRDSFETFCLVRMSLNDRMMVSLYSYYNCFSLTEDNFEQNRQTTRNGVSTEEFKLQWLSKAASGSQQRLRSFGHQQEECHLKANTIYIFFHSRSRNKKK